MSMRFVLALSLFSGALVDARRLLAEDWPMWGRDQTRNMVSPEKHPPTDWQIAVTDVKSGAVTQAARNIKWSVHLGSQSRGAPVVANGLVWVGTNNDQPRDPKHQADASVLMCFRESDGKFLGQYVSPRGKGAGAGRGDRPRQSIGSCPLVEGDRLWFITNRWEVVCLDGSPLRRGEREPHEVWKIDLHKEFGVKTDAFTMAAGIAPSLAASYKDLIYAVTGNSRDQHPLPVSAPDAPSLACLNKNTGQVVWKDSSPGKNIIHIQLSSPLVLEINGRGQVIIGQGDGWLRSFEATTGKLIWKCDLNPKDSKLWGWGSGARSYVMATPVFWANRIYLAIGMAREFAQVEGCLFCIDPTKEGDVSVDLEDTPGRGKRNPNSAVLWHTPRGRLSQELAEKLERTFAFGSTMSTCVVHDGLVYAPEMAGFLHCLDAKSGAMYWRQDLYADVWGSPLWVDGKIYLGTADGEVWIFPHGKEKKEPTKINMDSPVYSSPVFANGVLYIMTQNRLYAIQERK
jgi:outer membrane protein assembly factor BamB